MIDETTTTRPDEATKSQPDETFEWTDESGNGSAAASAASSAGATGREWIAQLQSMIENAATQAAPVMREVAAKAAELAAVAGDKAGPVAARAAELTAEAGHRIAERSRDFAADLRREAAVQAEPGTAPVAAVEPVEPMKDDEAGA